MTDPDHTQPEPRRTLCHPDEWPRPISDRRLRRIEKRLRRAAESGKLRTAPLRVLESRATVYRVRRQPWPPKRWCPWQAEPADDTIDLWPAAVRAFTRDGCERRALREYRRRSGRG